jgi:hypothetical protein
MLGLQPDRSSVLWLRHQAGAFFRPHTTSDWRSALCGTLHMTELLRLTGAAHVPGPRPALTGLLDASCDPQGGWARRDPDLETTALALRLIRLANLPIFDRAAVVDLIRQCENPEFGFRIRPTTRSTSVGASGRGLSDEQLGQASDRADRCGQARL